MGAYENPGLILGMFVFLFRFHPLQGQSRKPILCLVCGKSFASTCGLMQHMRLHTGKGYPCQICGMEFTTAVNLRRHQQVHSQLSERRMFKCGFCDKTFSRADNRDRHQRDRHQKPCAVTGLQEKAASDGTASNWWGQYCSDVTNFCSTQSNCTEAADL